MKRWLTHATIVAYLGALSWGIFAHSLRVGLGSHPAMYFVVWDMFCGWAAWEARTHVIGEGASGRYYELAPGPWGEFRPFGRLGRRNYDPNLVFSARLGLNCLRHTRHEPIVRMFVVEESWPKKFNLPDRLWVQRYDRPKDVHEYYRVRHVLTGEGQLLHTYTAWLPYQSGLCLADNPRLRGETRRAVPYLPFGAATALSHPHSSGGQFGVSAGGRVGSPLGHSSSN